MAKTCQICGKPSGMYPLCPACFKLRDAGKALKCEECGTWHLSEKACSCKANTISTKTSEEETTCIICGSPSNGKPQCLDCYHETRDFVASLNKNGTVREIRDHYYNLRDSIFTMKTLEYAKTNSNKLIAIALVAEEVHKDTSLIDRVYTDVKKLLEAKKSTPEDKYIEEKKETDSNKEKINTAQDGHQVKSNGEVIIDDILYKEFILHCYDKPISEILEERRKADWYIPIVNSEGIYIEYWGMETQKYKEDRKEKEALYEKYNVPFIGIEKDDPIKDTLTFANNLVKEITMLAINRYGFMPKWKK